MSIIDSIKKIGTDDDLSHDIYDVTQEITGDELGEDDVHFIAEFKNSIDERVSNLWKEYSKLVNKSSFGIDRYEFYGNKIHLSLICSRGGYRDSEDIDIPMEYFKMTHSDLVKKISEKIAEKHKIQKNKEESDRQNRIKALENELEQLKRKI